MKHANKKLLALFMAGTMIAGMAACGSDEGGETSDTANEQITAATSTTASTTIEAPVTTTTAPVTTTTAPVTTTTAPVTTTTAPVTTTTAPVTTTTAPVTTTTAPVTTTTAPVTTTTAPVTTTTAPVTTTAAPVTTTTAPVTTTTAPVTTTTAPVTTTTAPVTTTTVPVTTTTASVTTTTAPVTTTTAPVTTTTAPVTTTTAPVTTTTVPVTTTTASVTTPQPPVTEPAPSVTEGTKWNNKRGAFLGDSLTSGGRYTNALNRKYGITVNNYGISGTTISNVWQTNTFVERVDGMSDDIDFVFVMGGTNDWALSAAIGTPNDLTNDTFYGALNNLFSALRSKYPTKPIFVSTITQRNYIGDPIPGIGVLPPGVEANANDDSIQDFNDAIRCVANQYGCVVMDGYSDSGITLDNLSDYTYDNLHFNDLGGEKFADFIKSSMEAAK